MMTTSQARKAINDKIKAFTGLPQSKIQWNNQPKFAPPTIGVWSRVIIQYADSGQAGLNNGQCERDFGIINIQCFERKGAGDVALTDLAEAWRDHFKGWAYQFIEVTQTNAPTATIDELSTDFISTLVRIDFRVN